jgi:cysteine-rich repeat protein
MRTTHWLNSSFVFAVPVATLIAGCCTCPDDGTTSSTSSSTSSSSQGGAGGEAGSGGNGGAGGVGGGAANDTCPGEQVMLVLDTPQTLLGSTTNAADDYTSFCADVTAAADAPDVAYQVVLPQACTLQFDLEDGPGFDGAISVREVACDLRSGGDACVNLATDNETYRANFEAGMIWVVIDGVVGTSGDYALTLTCFTPECGDGIVNAGEECDPGAGTPGDSCIDPGAANECQFEPSDPMLDTCDGQTVPIALNDVLVIPATPPAGDTTGAANDYQGTCQAEMGGHDQVYHFVPSAAGTLTVNVGNDELGMPYCDDLMSPGCWDRALYVRGPGMADCTGAELACSDDPNDGTTVEQVSIPVAANMHYYVIVDGYDGESYSFGQYYLHATLTP